jgi:ElaB/YqjD/DUF883 family membrane-anchored ribosome-binding protein
MTEVAGERQQDEGVRQRAASTVQEAASATQEKAVELRSKSADQLREQLNSRTNGVGSQARSVAQALRRSGENLRGEGNTQAAGITEGAAERVEQLGRYLEQVDGDQMLRDAERFARQRPWLLAGIGLLSGLVASRMMKASSERRYQPSQRTMHPGEPVHTGGSDYQTQREAWERASATDAHGHELGTSGRGT